MKEARVSAGPNVEIVDSPIPEPGDNQVLIKVVVSGSNPKDWKMPKWTGTNNNEGDDIAGEVVKVGKNVVEFKPGDRVAAFHQPRTPHGSYAEYALSVQYMTFHIPKTTSFEEAATVPLAAATSAVALYSSLGLPQPWTPVQAEDGPTPLIIYGGGTAVGAFAVQLAARSNIHPLIVVAGKSGEFVRGLLDESRGDALIDYRDGEEAVVAGIREAGRKSGVHEFRHALDAVSESRSYVALGKALAAQGSQVTTVLPVEKIEESLPAGVRSSFTSVGMVFNDENNGKDLGQVVSKSFTRGLAEGWLKPHPHKVVPGGLGGVERALSDLRDGKASATKFVFRIAETEGAGRDKI